MEEYAGVKANIFAGQDKSDFLILNKSNSWTNFFLDQRPKSQILFVSLETVLDKNIFTRERIESFKKEWGEHNLENLITASLGAYAMDQSIENINKAIDSLPKVKFRQEKVFDNENFEIYNDTTATSPEATIVAIERFSTRKEKLVLISGGTDRELEYKDLAINIKKHIHPRDLVLLSGSATEKLKQELSYDKYNEYDTLEMCVKRAIERGGEENEKIVILFSPGAKSFEKFENEFDRGKKFNLIIERLKK
jgi:UDP-N-acetylmuramoylalanine--D-glutamate ligase